MSEDGREEDRQEEDERGEGMQEEDGQEEAMQADRQPGGHDDEFDVVASEFDRTTSEFLDVESDVEEFSGSAWVGAGDTTAVVVGVQRVDSDAVPDGYPLDVETDEALQLTVEPSPGSEAVVFVEWPESLTTDAQLTRLLRGLGLDPHSFADLQRREIPLLRDDGFLYPYVPPEVADVSSKWYLGVAASILLWVVLSVWPDNLYQGAFGYVSLTSWILFPLTMYFDTRWVRSYLTWNPVTVLWLIGSVIPILNILVGAGYLFKRFRTTSLRAE